MHRTCLRAAFLTGVACLPTACSGGSAFTTPSASFLSSIDRNSHTQGRLDTSIGRLGLPPGTDILGLDAINPPVNGWMSPAARTQGAKIYASDGNANAIVIYSATNPGQPIGAITSGLHFPLGSFVDANGNLFVANEGADNVLVFAPGSTSPSKTLSGLHSPSGVAVGRDGTVYVAEYSQNAVVKFDRGATSPSRSLSIVAPEGVALDAANNLYVSYIRTATSSDVEEFPAKSATAGKPLGLKSLSFAGDLKVDTHNDLIVEDQDPAYDVKFYKPGATTPYQMLNTAGDAYRLALSKDEKLIYTADPFNFDGPPFTDITILRNSSQGGIVGLISAGLTSCYGVSLSEPAPL